jgi:hypothetical protein
MNLILKPESRFKNLRSFLTDLPLDYYILLQDGFMNKREGDFSSTNYVLLSNLPL